MLVSVCVHYFYQSPIYWSDTSLGPLGNTSMTKTIFQEPPPPP